MPLWYDKLKVQLADNIEQKEVYKLHALTANSKYLGGVEEH